MSSVLVFGSVEGGRLTSQSVEAASLATKLASELSVPVNGALFGYQIDDAASTFATAGLQCLSVIDDERLKAYTGDLALSAAAELVARSGADTILIPSDANSIEWGARLAARLSGSLAGSCTGATVRQGEVFASRPVSGGALKASYRMMSSIRVLLLAPGSQMPAPASQPCEIRPVALPPTQSSVELVEFIPEETGSGPQLRNAQIVVSGGMGIGSADNWTLIEGAADALGAAVGATRAAVEVGWAAPTRQVGFSGLKIGPDLYVAVGISGALHHLAGIERAKTIVAINSDPDANIFKAAHLGVVGDAKEIIPAFIDRVRELRA